MKYVGIALIAMLVFWALAFVISSIKVSSRLTQAEEQKKRYLGESGCVCCGEEIPEGRKICINCERQGGVK